MSDLINLGILLSLLIGVFILLETYFWIRGFKKEVEQSAISAIPFSMKVKNIEKMYYAVEADDYVSYRLWINRAKREAENERRESNCTQ